MAANKTTLRTAHVGDVFRFGDTEVTHEGTEFPSKQAAAEAIETAALNGVQLYVLEPTDQDEAPDPDVVRVQEALIASGLVDESDKQPKVPAQNQGGQQGGNS